MSTKYLHLIPILTFILLAPVCVYFEVDMVDKVDMCLYIHDFK